MNSDTILKLLNRMANDRKLPGNQRSIVSQAMQHIRKQDEETSKIKEDVSRWRVPKDES